MEISAMRYLELPEMGSQGMQINNRKQLDSVTFEIVLCRKKEYSFFGEEYALYDEASGCHWIRGNMSYILSEVERLKLKVINVHES